MTWTRTVTVGTKTAITSSTGAYAITDLPAGTIAISVAAAGYDTWSGSVSVTAGAATVQQVALTATPVTPPAPVAANLARAGTASASSTNGSYSASRAIDGSTSSYWRSGSGGTQWLRVDLGSARDFDRVVVNWDGSRYARAYRVETSPDGRNWTSRYSTSRGGSGTETITFSSVSARYVRVYMTTTNDSHYRIREFEVWGY